MASLTTFASVQPVTVRSGLGGSSLTGPKLPVKGHRRNLAKANVRSGCCGTIVAEYGDKSVYFDLEDIGNTTGQWDLASSSRHLQLHSPREDCCSSSRSWGGGFTLAYLTSSATGDILPIKKGPTTAL